MILRREEDRRPRRVARTVLLGTAALGLGLVWLARELELDTGELLDYLRTSLLFVGVFAVFGVVGAIVVRAIRRLIR